MNMNTARAISPGLEDLDRIQPQKPKDAPCQNAGFKAIGIAAVASASLFSGSPAKSRDAHAPDRTRTILEFLYSDDR